MGKTAGVGQSAQERRECFRVDDVLSTVCRKIDPGEPHLGSRILPGFAEDYMLREGAEECPDEGVNPHLWGMLLQIHNRLGLILHRMNMEDAGIAKARPVEISLGTGGARFKTREQFAAGDLLEMKILLPLDTPQWVVVYGEVLRCGRPGGGGEEAEVAVRFVDAEEQVSAAIGRYCLKRQRGIIRKRREF